MKSLILYASRHHGNTKKLVTHLASQYDITLINAEETTTIDYSSYDLIGFASGMDFGKFHPSVTDLARQLPSGKSVYALYTCAKDHIRYGSQIEEIAQQTHCHCLGKFGCRGYNTYGPWKLIGGMNKHHPDPEELDAVCGFYAKILSLAEKQRG